MGLFRRANKLLRLGSGLRDCCCRPENPEECWCPDLCRYYWDWSGTTLTDAKQYLTNGCDTATDIDRRFSGDTTAVGFLSRVFSDYTDIGGSSSNFYGIGFAYSNFIEGYLSEDAYEDLFGFRLSAEASYYVIRSVILECVKNGNGQAFDFKFTANETIDIRVYIGQPTPYFLHLVDRQAASDALGLAVTCETNDRLFCYAPPVGSYGDRLHLAEDVGFSFSESGVTVNGTLYSWTETPTGAFGLPIVDNRTATELWKVSGDFPTEATVTLKRRASCKTGPCDCTASLTGSTVTFEGKTFTYGSLQSFTEGGTTWEETSAGIFRRTDRETCDGTYVAYVKQAEVTCDTSGAEDLWIVYLDAECYERDEATCPASPDGRRDMGWTGVFTCSEDGKPSGSPHSATDASAPPDEDYNTTGPTPTAECAADLAIPSISFGG